MSQRNADKKTRRALALKAFREGKGGRLGGLEEDEYELPNESDIYDVVEEQEYEKLVEARRQREDFVVNDDGLGYHDDGEERLGDEAAAYNNNEDEKKRKRGKNDLSLAALKRARKQRQAAAAKSIQDDSIADDKQQNTMWQFLKRGVGNNNNASSAKGDFTNHGTTSIKVELDSLLNSLDDDIPAISSSRRNNRNRRYGRSSMSNHRKSSSSRHRPSSYVSSPPKPRRLLQTPEPVTSQQLDEDDYDAATNNWDDDDDNIQDDNKKHVRFDENIKEGAGGDEESKELETKNNVKDDVVTGEEGKTKDAEDSVAKDDTAPEEQEEVKPTRRRRMGGLKLSKAAAKAEAEKAAAAKAEAEKLAAEKVSSSSAPTTTTPSMNTNIATARQNTAACAAKLESVIVSPEGEESSYIDMYWLDACDVKGDIYVFGKIKDKETNSFVSACAMVRNHQRQLFVLPREGSEMLDVHTDVKQVLSKVIPSKEGSSWKGKVVTRSYAFEDASLPREPTQYLKTVYAASHGVPSPEVCENGTKHIARILGSGSSNLENFLIKRDLMGPAWIRIKDPSPSRCRSTWCALEFDVESPKDVSRITDVPPPPPPVVAVSLKLKTAVNPKTHKSEIVSLSALCHSKVSLDTTTPEEDMQHMSQLSLIRPLQGRPFPRGFVPPEQMKTMPNERAMLCRLVVQLGNWDPDVLVGHHAWGYDLQVLLTRCVDLKVSWWSKFGRRRRQPTKTNFSSSEWSMAEALQGRLVCDTYLSAKEFLRSETSYGLTALAQSQFEYTREEILPMDIPAYFEDSSRIVALASHTLADAQLIQRLFFRLNLLPLTKQLTNVAGNLWSTTLKGNRANRTEFLLLHEFHNQKTLPPEKKKRKAGRGGAKYAGGLVLEPKRGYYDSFILLLDFNSLYPSLIQEYNLCFTTLHNWAECCDHGENGGDITSKLEMPDESAPQGVLPRVIATLVQRRRTVKKLMKSESNPNKKKELDIRQQALKLTANSMYGCLGFSNSRFFAQPIAAMVTKMGRETLQRTVDIASEKIGLEVIYGDTDSIMINTLITDPKQYAQVRRLGEQVKGQVNKLYQTLELEIDGTFRSMLLLKKKKYAAITAEPNKDGTGLVYGKEMKGLDLVRRDWCIQSKDTGKYVLDQILNADNDRETVVLRIHEHLQNLAQTMREGKLPLEKYVITKGLSKHPKDYPDAKVQPHVQVAKQLLAQNRPVHCGDHIPYIITTTPADLPPVQRACHPDDMKDREPDVTYYLTQQILPPISRLCEPVEGTSMAILAEQLGLDGARYQQQQVNSETSYYDLKDEELINYVPQSLRPPAERFKDVEPLTLRCRSCGVTSAVSMTSNCLGCSNPECSKPHLWGYASHYSLLTVMSNRLQKYVYNNMQRYYRSGYQCDDPACGLSTRQISVAGPHVCLVPGGCSGTMRPKVSENKIHQQLQYLSYLFKNNDNKDSVGEEEENGVVYSKIDRVILQELQKVTQQHLKRSAYNWIEPTLWQQLFPQQ